MISCFREDAGKVSFVRVAGLISLVFGGVIGLYGIYKELAPLELSALVTPYIAGCFGAKVWQKKYESKLDSIK